MIAHDFNVGDNITVTDHHSSVGVYSIPCYVQEIDGDYYIMRKRDFTSAPFRIGKYYPHMKKEV
jgi:hypothetical protein